MPKYEFSVIVSASPATHEGILDATDALGNVGCTDASIRGHREGMELLFERDAESLQAAIASAISDIESAGYCISRVELKRDAVLQTA